MQNQRNQGDRRGGHLTVNRDGLWAIPTQVDGFYHLHFFRCGK